jgi:4-hydroxy-tetrahydrodipicolinate reductase
MIQVGVSGASGRMGTAVCDAVTDSDGMTLAGRADPSLDIQLGEIIPEIDVLVEFSTPDTVVPNAAEALSAGIPTVVGATGFEVEDLRQAAEESGTNCFFAPNFALGAVLLMKLATEVASHMPECEIIEFHHEGKLDRPSGTALRTRDLIEAAGGNVHEPIGSVRLPGLVAHQEVIFGGTGQTLTLRHDSLDRTSFMPGVLLAIEKVASLPEVFTVGLETLLFGNGESP